jgi:Tol biopolymer transport system component
MTTKQCRKISSPALLFPVILILFGAAMSFAQTPALRANGKIAFTSDRDGNPEIYVMNADGTNQVRITNNAVVDDFPTWSPDGTKIAFVSESPSGGYAIYRMNADGTNKAEITPINYEASLASISWSPDSRRIVFQDCLDIVIVNIDDGIRQYLTNGPEWDSWPSWSPDGSKILFSRILHHDSSHIYSGTIMHTIKPDGTDLRELPNGHLSDGWNDDHAHWSPSGDKIVFLVNVWDFWLSIYTANADGTNRQFFDGCVWPNHCQDRLNPSWSPDGTHIIFGISNWIARDSEIYLKSIDGSAVVQLTNTIGKNFNSSWQPLASSACLNPIDCGDSFVRQHYLDFLSREPDAGGLAYWINEITQCGSDAACINARRVGVSAAFFIEQEFQETGYFLYRLYKASFGRQPDFTEFTSDRSRIIPGNNLQVSKEGFANEWVQRPGFVAAFPITMSNTEFVNKIFEFAGLVGSRYDPIRQQEISAMNAGRSRALVLRDLVEIPDFKNIPDPNDARYSELKQISQYNPAFVLMQYFGYLRRDVDPAGYAFWLDIVNNREPNNYRGMVCAFITSSEYQLRFGSVATRSNANCG